MITVVLMHTSISYFSSVILIFFCSGEMIHREQKLLDQEPEFLELLKIGRKSNKITR